MDHRNAPLSETGRLRLACCVVDQGWSLRRAAERFQVSVTTAARWAGRIAGRVFPVWPTAHRGRSHSPNQTPTRTERRIIKVRMIRRWGLLVSATYWVCIPAPGAYPLRAGQTALAGPAHRAGDPPHAARPLRRHRPCRRQKTRQDPRRRWLANAGPHHRQTQRPSVP